MIIDIHIVANTTPAIISIGKCFFRTTRDNDIAIKKKSQKQIMI
jgi:hypothetical protein